MKSVRLVSFCALLLLPCILLAQSGNATLSGTVHDPSGAIVPNAKVTALNSATGITKETSTNASGLYVIPNLIPGPYNVSVSAPNFQSKQIQGIVLNVD